jgi:hypothetical protein
MMIEGEKVKEQVRSPSTSPDASLPYCSPFGYSEGSKEFQESHLANACGELNTHVVIPLNFFLSPSSPTPLLFNLATNLHPHPARLLASSHACTPSTEARKILRRKVPNYSSCRGSGATRYGTHSRPVQQQVSCYS